MSITVTRNADVKVKIANWEVKKAYISDAGNVFIPLTNTDILRISEYGVVDYIPINSLNGDAKVKEVDIKIIIGKEK